MLTKYNGFTLAETLITLGIIGVVAALTIPTLITKYKKQVVATQVKKFYTNMSQAIKLSEAENGEFRYWQYMTTDELYDNYLAKYLKVIQVQRNIHMYGNFTKGIKFIFSDGTMAICSAKTNLEGYGNNAAINPCVFYTKSIGHWRYNSTQANYTTHDIFWFLITEDGILEPPHMKYTRLYNINSCQSVNHFGNGMTDCGTLLYKDGWVIADDYPW